MKFKSNIEVQAGIEDKDGQVGSNGQILASTGSQVDWVDPASIVTSATDVIIECKNTSGVTIAKGTPVYQTGNVGATAVIEVAVADASDEDKMAAIGLLQSDLINNAFGYVVVTGELLNITTSPIDGSTPTVGDTIYVKPGGGLTLTKPTGVNFIQNVGLVGKVSGGNAGSLTVSSIMRSNDVPTPLYIDHDNQRLGVGATSPSQKLDVSGIIAVNGVKFLSTIGSESYIWNNTGGLSVVDDTGNTVQLRIKDNGNVAIGTTNPSEKLVVDGKIRSLGGTSSADFYSTGNDALIVNNGTQNLKFWNNGSERMRIKGDGNVGIGTTSPTAKLHVTKDNTTGNALLITNSGSSRSLEINHNADGAGVSDEVVRIMNNGTRLFTIESDGNVGIGTASPQRNLTIYESSGNAVLQLANNTSGVGASDGFLAYTDGTNVGLENKENGYLSLATNASEKMRVTSDGNVGIGTTSPVAKLEVSTDGYEVSKFTGNTNDGTGYVGAVLEIETNNDARGRGVYLTHREDTDTADSEWYAGVPYTGGGYSIGNAAYGTSINSATGPAHKDQSKIFIKEDGNVGIGTTSPATKLHINEAGTSLPALYIETARYGASIIGNGTSNSQYLLNLQSNGGSTDVMRVQSSGNVGIGVTDPEKKLEVKSDTTYDGIMIDVLSAPEITFRDRGNSDTKIGTGRHQLDGFHIDTYSGNAFFIKGSNRYVGIGTTSPSEKLEVQGGNIKIDTTTNADAKLILNPYSSALGTAYQWELVGASSSQNYNFQIREAGQAYVTVDSSVSGNAGNVGIGTTSPGEKLSVYDSSMSTGYVASFGNTSNLELLIGTTTGAYLNIQGSNISSGASYNISLQNDGGNVGIGTTIPSQKLEVNGAVLAGDYRGSANIYLTSPDSWIFRSTGGNERMRVTSAGNVGIGTTSPGAKLEVNGNIKVDNVLLSNQQNTDVSGLEVVANVLIASYTAAFFDFVIKKGTNVRSGTVYACHDGTNVEFTETSTNDLGDTSDVVLSVDISGTGMRLLADAATSGWSVKSLIRAI